MRSIELFVLLTVSILLITSGCSSDSGIDRAGISQRAEDTLLSPADSSLHISDTISIDLMADYGIVSVDDIDANETGRIAILDGSNAMVTVISGTGDFIADAGGSGSGPGEFQWPGALSISEDGFVAVSDLMAGTVRILEPGLYSYRDITGFMMANPGVIWLTSEDSFAGMRMVFRSEDGTTMIGYQTAFWEEGTSEPSIIFREELEPFTPNDFGRSIITPYPMTCTGDGDILTAEVSTEEYMLYCFEPNGDLNWSMEYPFQRVAKSELDIRTEEDMVERRMQQTAHQADYTADPFHYSVSMMALGPEGRIWVMRPGAETSFFDVLDAETGLLLFTASLEEDISLSRLEVTRAGILGVTEGEVPSLVRLSLSAP
jgi:hypothetical protein